MFLTGYTRKHLVNALGMYLADWRIAHDIAWANYERYHCVKNLEEAVKCSNTLQEIDDTIQVVGSKCNSDLGRQSGIAFPVEVQKIADEYERLRKESEEQSNG